MRILLTITAVAVVAFTVWAISPTVAKQRNTVSIDPIGLDLVRVPCREVGEYWPLVSP